MRSHLPLPSTEDPLCEVLEVKKQDDPGKFRGKVEVIGHDVDLALVSVADEAFWTEPQPLEPVSWDNSADFAELYSEVRAVGFPTGGSTVRPRPAAHGVTPV